MRAQLSIGILLFFLLTISVFAQDLPRNYDTSQSAGEISIASVISITDSGWSTNTSTSDCATGWGDDQWNLHLTQPRNLTVTVTDCCCPGDYYEVYVDDRLIGTTPVPSAWGCSQSGSTSSGAFTVPLCPGDHVIKVRDAGFDGHSFTQIQQENMCPAGFSVAGALGPSSAAQVTTLDERRIQMQPDTSERAAELEKMLSQVEPYVYVDANGLERLNVAQAKRAGVSGDAISLAMRVIALDNRVTAAAKRGEESNLTRADFAFIEPLFLQIAQTDPCGDRQNPAPCPSRVESGRFFATRDEVVQHLESIGFHLTSRYASRGGFGSDFTRVVTHPCGGSSFREQAIIRQANNCWTYNLQGPEPNPEVLEYIWPRFAWPGYVQWWHLTFC